MLNGLDWIIWAETAMTEAKRGIVTAIVFILINVRFSSGCVWLGYGRSEHENTAEELKIENENAVSKNKSETCLGERA